MKEFLAITIAMLSGASMAMAQDAVGVTQPFRLANRIAWNRDRRKRRRY